MASLFVGNCLLCTCHLEPAQQPFVLGLMQRHRLLRVAARVMGTMWSATGL